MRKGLELLASRGRALLGWGAIVASIVLLAVGWYGVSGTPLVARQLAYLVSGGIGGLLAGIVGVGLLLSGDVRRDRERLGRIEADLLELRELLLAQSQALKAPTSGSPDSAESGSARAGARSRR